MYRVEVRNRGGRVVTVADDEYILDALEASGMRLPFGCRYGACATCAAFLLEGKVDHSKGRAFALRPEQRESGYILLCVARPRSDCVIEVGTQKGLYVNPFKHGRSKDEVDQRRSEF